MRKEAVASNAGAGIEIWRGVGSVATCRPGGLWVACGAAPVLVLET